MIINKNAPESRLETDDKHQNTKTPKHQNAGCATLIRPTGFVQSIEFAIFCRPDKAFTPHPASTKRTVSAIRNGAKRRSCYSPHHFSFLAPSVGVSSKKFHGFSSVCTHSVGIIGHSSARATCVVPVVIHTTVSVLSSDSLSLVY